MQKKIFEEGNTAVAITVGAFIVGLWVRYQYDEGFWDEWFLQFDNQRAGWVEEDEGEFTLTFKSKLTSPIPPFDQVRVGGFIPLVRQCDSSVVR